MSNAQLREELLLGGGGTVPRRGVNMFLFRGGGNGNVLRGSLGGIFRGAAVFFFIVVFIVSTCFSAPLVKLAL